MCVLSKCCFASWAALQRSSNCLRIYLAVFKEWELTWSRLIKKLVWVLAASFLQPFYWLNHLAWQSCSPHGAVSELSTLRLRLSVLEKFNFPVSEVFHNFCGEVANLYLQFWLCVSPTVLTGLCGSCTYSRGGCVSSPFTAPLSGCPEQVCVM